MTFSRERLVQVLCTIGTHTVAFPNCFFLGTFLVFFLYRRVNASRVNKIQTIETTALVRKDGSENISGNDSLMQEQIFWKPE